jgi:hypothetical protein
LEYSLLLIDGEPVLPTGFLKLCIHRAYANSKYKKFYLLLLAAMLWAIMQQQAASLVPAHSGDSKIERRTRSAKTVTAQLSQVFQVPWRLLRKNLKVCANCLAQCFSF